MNRRKSRFSFSSRQLRRILVALFRVIVFPIGLLYIWSPRCRWNRALKCTFSVCAVALVVALVVLLPKTPEAEPGGITIVAAKPEANVLAPLAPENLPTMMTGTLATSSIISEPTATSEPIMVYCNDNGKYYHVSTCRYVKDTTPYVTLTAALNAGKTACPECHPPTP